MTSIAMLSPSVLHIDCAVAVRHIEESICEAVYHRLHRKGIVVGVSGGVDSGVVAAVAARALGSDRVIGLVMPDADSASESAELAQMLGQALGIRMIVEDVTATLAAAGCYRRRDEAIRSVVPEYDDGYRCKIVLPDLVTLPGYPLYAVVVRSPSGEERRVRLPLDAYLGIVAATNFKQRVRKMMEYYYADRFRFAVAGTANRLEHDQGFIVQKAVRHIPFRPLDVGKLCFLRFEGVPHIAPSMLRGRATVRRGTSADIAELERLQNRGEIFDERFANGDHCVVALADGRIVGYEWFCDAEMHHETAWGYPIAIPRGLVYVYDAHIDAAHRNSGVWLRFKAYLRDWMIATGKRGVLTFVEDGNLSSLRTHLRFGFTPTETVLAVKVFGVSRFRKVSDTSV